jgi:hypothetical protein
MNDTSLILPTVNKDTVHTRGNELQQRYAHRSPKHPSAKVRSDFPLLSRRRCITGWCIPERVAITTKNPSIATGHEAFVPDRALDRQMLRHFFVVVSFSILCSGLLVGQKVDVFGSSACGLVLPALALAGLIRRDAGAGSRGRDM